MMLRASLLLFLLLRFTSLFSQSGDTAVFSFDTFRSLLLNNHPIARQAALQPDKGESTVRRARGKFDPKLEASFNEKQYLGKEYYSLNNAELKIPTAAAIDLKGGFDLNSGVFLNPEDQTPDNGLLTAGISVPILQGLMMDERRAALRMAKAFNQYSQLERDVILNDLILRGSNAYWDWWASTEKLKVATDIQRIADERFLAVRTRALAGQAPIIDTVEAFIQVQLRRQNVQEARANEIKTRLTLSAFVWDAGEVPVPRILSATNQPQLPLSFYGSSAFVLGNFLQYLDSIGTSNPIVLQYDYKLQSLSAEERWKREKLKPKLNVNYNMLSFASDGVNTPENTAFSTNNYKVGIDFSFPLLLREGRGDLQLQRIKIKETQFDQMLKTQEVRNKARTAWENSLLLTTQLNIASTNVANYQVMLEGERTKFFNGESSLFLVNQRELQFVDARNKVIDLEVKVRALQYEALYWVGKINS